MAPLPQLGLATRETQSKETGWNTLTPGYNPYNIDDGTMWILGILIFIIIILSIILLGLVLLLVSRYIPTYSDKWFGAMRLNNMANSAAGEAAKNGREASPRKEEEGGEEDEEDEKDEKGEKEEEEEDSSRPQKEMVQISTNIFVTPPSEQSSLATQETTSGDEVHNVETNIDTSPKLPAEPPKVITRTRTPSHESTSISTGIPTSPTSSIDTAPMVITICWRAPLEPEDEPVPDKALERLRLARTASCFARRQRMAEARAHERAVARLVQSRHLYASLPTRSPDSMEEESLIPRARISGPSEHLRSRWSVYSSGSEDEHKSREFWGLRSASKYFLKHF
ncbi:hypothetical protein TWF481_010553 [Arthrobotrys musiformis]|uniref:Uncharacterized protein n=1 Tax=Arthrobotrys musiformis TaxID=47236 RepID=A0AAV9W138_9PEZI